MASIASASGFSLVQVASHTWLSGCTCLLREFAGGGRGQISVGALLPNDHPSINISV